MQVGENEPFPFELALAAEVQQVTNLPARDAHVIEQLGLVFRQ